MRILVRLCMGVELESMKSHHKKKKVENVPFKILVPHLHYKYC